jgi:rSAM/selenodomain-associated transferase 2
MDISIIIPAYNEEAHIEKLVVYLKENSGKIITEVIVADGGSTDNTIALARKAGALAVASPARGRGTQMNYGASFATGAILYFVHADTFPAKNYTEDIFSAASEGYSLGRYRTRFLSPKKLLRINEWFTRFDLFICMGGDQTLFIKKELFDSLGGFNEEMMLMEEYEFCTRARARGKYKIMTGAALISARKFEKNTWLRVQMANYKVVQLYKKGAPSQILSETYKRMLKW